MPEVGSAPASAAPILRSLLPAGPPTDAHTFVSRLDFTGAPDWRPHTIVNFVSSADGRATIGGRSGALGGAADLELMKALRERADALLVGTGTLAIERYASVLDDRAAQDRRLADNRLPQPLVVTFSRKGTIPFNIPLFSEPDAKIVVFSRMKVTLPRLAAQVRVELIPDDARDPLAFMAQVLRSRFGVQLLLCEGGPSLFGALLSAGLTDELFLTIAAKLAGRAGNHQILDPSSSPSRVTPLALQSVLESDGELLARYRIGG